MLGDVVLAPHPDDEVIGLYDGENDVLRGAFVITFYAKEKRKKEWQKMLKYFGAKGVMVKSVEEIKNYLKNAKRIFIPSYHDYHPLHKSFYTAGVKYGEGKEVYEYSVEKNVGWLKEVKDPKEKEALLDTLYPSQKELWKSNKKYIYFVGIRRIGSKSIVVRFEYEGFHRWKEAKNFLKNWHRHMFKVEAKIPMEKGRGLEFFEVKKELMNYVKKNFEGKKVEYSCEDIAERIAFFIVKQYGVVPSYVRVSEDGENDGEWQA